jgi:hypothetical protein
VGIVAIGESGVVEMRWDFGVNSEINSRGKWMFRVGVGKLESEKFVFFGSKFEFVFNVFFTECIGGNGGNVY